MIGLVIFPIGLSCQVNSMRKMRKVCKKKETIDMLIINFGLS